MLFAYAFAVILPVNHALADSAGKVRQLSQSESAKLSGLILSRDGDLIRLHDPPLLGLLSGRLRPRIGFRFKGPGSLKLLDGIVVVDPIQKHE